MRTAQLFNRKDTNVRRPQHDLDAATTISDLFNPGGDPCDPCGDCKRGGVITECEHCRSATLQQRFTFPEVEKVVKGETPRVPTEYTLEWAEECTWESDNLPVTCDEDAEEPDQYGFALVIAGRNPGEVALTFSRREGEACDEIEFTYRNFYPLKCLCPMLMFLDPESLAGIEAEDLPCSLCIEPFYSGCVDPLLDDCECPDNWRILIGDETVVTTSGPLSPSGNTIDRNFCWWYTASAGAGGYYVVQATRGNAGGPANQPFAEMDVYRVLEKDLGDPYQVLGLWFPPFTLSAPNLTAWWHKLEVGMHCGDTACKDDVDLNEVPAYTIGSADDTITLQHHNANG